VARALTDICIGNTSSNYESIRKAQRGCYAFHCACCGRRVDAFYRTRCTLSYYHCTYVNSCRYIDFIIVDIAIVSKQTSHSRASVIKNVGVSKPTSNSINHSRLFAIKCLLIKVTYDTLTFFTATQVSRHLIMLILAFILNDIIFMIARKDQ